MLKEELDNKKSQLQCAQFENERKESKITALEQTLANKEKLSDLKLIPPGSVIRKWYPYKCRGAGLC